MSIIRKFFNSTKSWTMPGWGRTIPLSSTGEIITNDTATSLGIVFACIQVRANAVAKLPLQVFKKTDQGRERARDHQVAYLLETRPNKYMTPYQFKFLTEANRLTHGIAYWQMDIDKRGQVIAINLLNPASVSVVMENDKVYFVETLSDGNTKKYVEDEIIRLPLFSTSLFEVKSPISVARENIGVLRSQQKFIGSFYKNGAVGSGVVKVDTPLNKEARKKVRDEFSIDNAGIDENGGKVIILAPGLSYEPINLPLQDAEFIASANFNLREIARIFGVSPHLVGDLEKATFSNIEHQAIEFVQNTIQPSCIAIEEELNYKLFTRKEQKEGLYVKFNMTSALRGDSQTQANVFKTGIECGWFSVNEIREYHELNKIEGGDVHRVSLNGVNIAIADEYQRAKSGATSEGGE